MGVVPLGPSAPLADVTVAAAVTSLSAPTLQYFPPERTEVTCDVSLKAEATGVGKADWLDATFDFFDLRDTTQLAGSVPIEASELKSAWNQDTIAAGQSEASRWIVTASTAFATAFRIRYRSGTATRATSVWVRCAPPTAQSGVSAPSITSMSVSPETGTIGAGTPIDVSFTANVPAGALMTILRATGPCVAEYGWSEEFETSLNHTGAVTLGYPCALGVPIGIDVITYDAMGNSVAAGQGTTVTMTDTLRPTTRAFFWHRGALDFIYSPYGQWAAGDTLWAEVHVLDDYKVEGLFLEVYPFGVADTVVVRDSLVDRTGAFGLPTWAINRFPVVLRPEWAGSTLQFRYYGRDAEGQLSNVFTTEAGCVTVTAPSSNLLPSATRASAQPRMSAAGTSCAYTAGDPIPGEPTYLSAPASAVAGALTPGARAGSTRSPAGAAASAFKATAVR